MLNESKKKMLLHLKYGELKEEEIEKIAFTYYGLLNAYRVQCNEHMHQKTASKLLK